MNERIRELWTQCVRKHNKDPMNWQNVADDYAVMIINECLTQVDKIRNGCEADGEDEQALGADWSALAIARHFGVE